MRGDSIVRDTTEVLLKDDLHDFLKSRYAAEVITDAEIDGIIRTLESKPASDLYDTNKAIMKMVSDGFLLKRDDRSKKDFLVQLAAQTKENLNRSAKKELYRRGECRVCLWPYSTVLKGRLLWQ